MNNRTMKNSSGLWTFGMMQSKNFDLSKGIIFYTLYKRRQTKTVSNTTLWRDDDHC